MVIDMPSRPRYYMSDDYLGDGAGIAIRGNPVGSAGERKIRGREARHRRVAAPRDALRAGAGGWGFLLVSP
jgi:hypothetical protein